jgi:predicted AAA+ superfamily ATPase
LVNHIPAWSFNAGKRFVKSPKIFLNDTGFMSDLLGYAPLRLEKDPGLPGPLFETFVCRELSKHLAWCRTFAHLYHYRTSTGVEVDFALENRQGEIVGIEVKASSSLGAKDWSGLKNLKGTLSDRFASGYVIYTGNSTVPLETGITALPASIFF